MLSRATFHFILILSISTWLGWLTYTNNQNQLTSNRQVLHSGQVLLTSEKLFNALLNIETSQRGYDNTNKKEFLTPYYAYRDSIDYHFQILQKLIADSPPQQQSVTKLKPLIDEKIRLTDEAIKSDDDKLTIEENLRQAWNRKRVMDQIRVLVNEMQQYEQTLLQERQERNATATITFNQTYFATVLFFTLLLMGLFIMNYISLKAAKISQAKMKEEADVAHRAKILLQASFESLKEIMIFSIDVNYRILNFNVSFSNATFQAYGTHVEIGKSILDCITLTEDKLKAKVNFDKAIAGQNHLTIEEYGLVERVCFETRYNPMRNDQQEIFGVTILTTDITAQKRNEAELVRLTTLARNAQLLLQSSIESLDGVNFFSIDSKYKYLNINAIHKQSMRYLYNQEVEIGSSILDYMTNDADREKLKLNLNRALAGESHISIEEYGDAEKAFYETRFNPIFADDKAIIGVSVISIDITKRLMDERKVNELAAVVASSDDAILSKSLDGIINTWNKGAERTFGYSFEEVAGKHISLLIPKHRIHEESYIIDQVKSGKLIRNYETVRVRKDGSPIPVSLSVSPIKDKNGNITGVAKIARDITEQKEAEAKLSATNKTLEEAKLAAELANRTKSQFLANMSHEIRTPLNAVIGLSHLALKTELTPKQADYLNKIQSSSESLLGIINDILDFSKVEAGKLILEEVSFDLEEIFQRLGNVITYKANAKGLEIAFGIDSRVPTYLIGDPVRLEQILINLCSNAVKFTHEGDVVVTVTVREETIDKIHLNFEVADTGIGMDEVQVSKLFVPFTQADDTISRKYGGTGLGLSIIKRLVELMEGTVSIDSKPGKGSRFYFNLWLKKQKHQRKIPVPSIDLRKLNVLLVEDSIPALKIMKEALESLSFKVTAIGSGIQAIHYLKNNYHHNPIKLILLDWKMDEMDGIETAKLIRQDQQFDDIKIIMMSAGYANEVLYEQAEELDLSGILIKPIRYSRLYNLIIEALENEESIEAEQGQRVIKETEEKFRGHLLLVEDNEINQQVARELLEGFGFTVEIAGNGQEALELVRNSGIPSRFNLVLMDLQMPVMGGRMATMEIRKLGAYEKLPIIAMTADAFNKIEEECIEIGMNDFIAKPINPNKMLETIVRWLGSDSIASTAVLEKEKVEIPEIYGVNLDDGLSHLGGNGKLFYDMLLKFWDNNESFAEDFLTAYNESDLITARRMIHTMKGLSGSLGMLQLHEMCISIEQNILDTTYVLSGVDSMKNELNAITQSIGRQLSKAVPKTMELNLDRIKLQLIDLEKSLLDHNPDAIQLLDEIGMISGLELEIEKLKVVLDNYEFEEALTLLEKLKSQLQV